jgi:hypothetical protein
MEINGVVKGHHSGLSPVRLLDWWCWWFVLGLYYVTQRRQLYCRLPFHVARALAVQAMKRDVNVHYNLFVP